MANSDYVSRWQSLGKAGLTVSIVYGRTGICTSAHPNGVFCFTVQCLSAEGEEFQRPFAAESFEQAVEIAEIESRKRGWPVN